MKSITCNGRTYTRFYAFWPTRTTSGSLVWLAAYYIRPEYNGQGLVLSHSELIADV